MPYAAVASENQKTPVSKEVLDRLSENIKIMDDRLLSIEDRCHRLLNRRTPEKEPDRKPTPMDSDLMQALNERVDILQELNGRLERVNRHLAELI